MSISRSDLCSQGKCGPWEENDGLWSLLKGGPYLEGSLFGGFARSLLNNPDYIASVYPAV